VFVRVCVCVCVCVRERKRVRKAPGSFPAPRCVCMCVCVMCACVRERQRERDRERETESAHARSSEGTQRRSMRERWPLPHRHPTYFVAARRRIMPRCCCTSPHVASPPSSPAPNCVCETDRDPACTPTLQDYASWCLAVAACCLILPSFCYGVATISRLLKIIRLFCRIRSIL